MNDRHYSIARKVAERLQTDTQVTPGMIAREFGIGNNHAYMIVERAREIHLRWQLGHFGRPVQKVAA